MRLNYGAVVMLNERVNNYITTSVFSALVCCGRKRSKVQKFKSVLGEKLI